MRAGHPAARTAGVSAVMGEGGDRPVGSAETGGGISNKIGDGVRGRFLRGRGRRRQGEFPGRERVQWSRVEDD